MLHGAMSCSASNLALAQLAQVPETAMYCLSSFILLLLLLACFELAEVWVFSVLTLATDVFFRKVFCSLVLPLCSVWS